MPLKTNIYLGIILVVTGFLNSCGTKPSYDEIIKEELAREIRFDSIAYGVELGMTFDDFKWRCLLQNRDGIFKPNATSDAVQITFTDGFEYPVNLEFFPADIQGEHEPIAKYTASLRYEGYSNFNKKMTMENLVKETIGFFENGYEGRKFIAVPNEKDPWIKNNYVKIDGNRKITLTPIYMGGELNVTFEDLKKASK